MMYFLGWIAFSLFIGLFADVRRNRSAFGWFVAALIFSPLLAGLFLAILDLGHDHPRYRSDLQATKPQRIAGVFFIAPHFRLRRLRFFFAKGIEALQQSHNLR
jgi:hypothetical protein